MNTLGIKVICYHCGDDREPSTFKDLLSDFIDEKTGKWAKMPYCKECQKISVQTRRGPVYDEWVTYDACDINTIGLKENTKDEKI